MVRAVWADIRRPARGTQAPTAALAVVDPGDTSLPEDAKLPLEPVTHLGRDPSNHVVLDEPAVSSRHAVISLNGRHWYLRDLESTNGTWVNRKRLGAQPVRLQDGDIIQLGRVALRFTT
ncbi:MAG TPA: FHA domain-containing protein [Dehalococcoidia bacterium]